MKLISMKNRTLGIGMVLFSMVIGCGDGEQFMNPNTEARISINASRDIEGGQASTRMSLRDYAQRREYLTTDGLKEGTKLAFAASYGVGGEAGQTHGVLIERDGKFLFKVIENTTGQLMLPPGLPLNSGKESLWDLGAYFELLNKIVFPPERVSAGYSQMYGQTSAKIVNFTGSTSYLSVTYEEALEVKLQSKNNGVLTTVAAYFVKGLGPVALEVTENGTPAGTFKLYVDYP